jgi:pimeloyl-ACP methyl ester carboxylesterase
LPFIDRGGVAIHYEATGSGDTVLFTHGFGATSAMFEGNLPAITERRRSVTWDLRGHGASAYPYDPAEYSVPLSVSDMVAVLDEVGAERAVLAGHSLGGFLSLALYAAHPERVRALVLIDTGPGYRQDEGRETWNRMAEKFAADFETRGLAALSSSEETALATHRDTSGLARAARGILTQRDPTVINSLHHIAVPAIVIVGENDKPFVGASQYMAHKIPHARLTVIDGAGHAPNVSHREQFDAALAAFLDELDDLDELEKP